MPLQNWTALIDAVARLIGALSWPVVFLVALTVLRAALRDFLSTLAEVRLRGAGFEAFARRRLNFDATSQKLYDIWRPGGTIDRTNAAHISACMKQLSISGSIAWLINAATEQDRARVASALSLR
jgi:hypothetical protein